MTKAWLVEWPLNDNMPTRWWNPDTGWMLDANKAQWFVRQLSDGRDVAGARRDARGGGATARADHPDCWGGLRSSHLCAQHTPEKHQCSENLPQHFRFLSLWTCLEERPPASSP